MMTAIRPLACLGFEIFGGLARNPFISSNTNETSTGRAHEGTEGGTVLQRLISDNSETTQEVSYQCLVGEITDKGRFVIDKWRHGKHVLYQERRAGQMIRLPLGGVASATFGIVHVYNREVQQ